MITTLERFFSKHPLTIVMCNNAAADPQVHSVLFSCCCVVLAGVLCFLAGFFLVFWFFFWGDLFFRVPLQLKVASESTPGTLFTNGTQSSSSFDDFYE